jgi:RNA polymerase sigma factor (sigma-70 family)
MSGSRRIVEELTARQREIMLLVAQGLANKEIARRLNITEGTVKVHLHQIYRCLGIRNRTALTTFVHRGGAD